MIFRFIAAKKAEHSIKTMCRVLGVSRSGFYAWAVRKPSKRQLEDERLTERIGQIHADNRGVYGSPRIHAELVLADGERIGRKRVERLTAPGRHHRPAAEEARKDDDPRARRARLRRLVDRAFLASAPNRLWVADITYLRTWEGWLYLVAVQDVFSRRIVGWAMADHMRTELVTDALQMALAQRRPEPGLIWHSPGQPVRQPRVRSAGPCRRDRPVDGIERRLLRQRRRRELLRDAQEGAHPRPLMAAKAELRTEVFEYIEIFFNRRRRHSTLGMLSPADFEQRTLSPDGTSLAASRLAPTTKIMFTKPATTNAA